MNSRQSFWFRRVILMLATQATILACMVPMAVAQNKSDIVDGTGDILYGWRVFREKQCATCHAIWDQGGHIGPDLGRNQTEHLTPGNLAGIMWNHIPKMLSRVKTTGNAPPVLSQDDMANLYALLFFVRSIDKPGLPVRGLDVLQNKGCTSCHSLDITDGKIGFDLAKWGSYTNPIHWSQLMWEHTQIIDAAMQQTGENWPKLEGSDLMHIIAYVRSVGTNEKKVYLYPGSISNGREQFASKGCAKCHPGAGPDLVTADLPVSIGMLATRMWNHSPELAELMNERGAGRQPIADQELTDILAYVLALRNHDPKGDIVKGEQSFIQKGCGSCHERKAVAHAVGPVVAQLYHNTTPIDMAAAMWNHGQTMRQRTLEASRAWSVFDGGEMVDLLEFLRSQEASPDASAPDGSQ